MIAKEEPLNHGIQGGIYWIRFPFLCLSYTIVLNYSDDDPDADEDEHAFCLYADGCVYARDYLPEAVQHLSISHLPAQT